MDGEQNQSAPYSTRARTNRIAWPAPALLPPAILDPPPPPPPDDPLRGSPQGKGVGGAARHVAPLPAAAVLKMR